MKKEFLKIAGLEKESDFYKLFPTEEAFFGMYPEAKKLVQKAYGGLIKAQDGIDYTGPSIVDYLATKGYQGSKAFRKGLAEQYGVENYDYSGTKNLELLDRIRKDQSILSQQAPTMQPVSVETLEQLHSKTKAGLLRHNTLPGKTEAKQTADLKKYDALLNFIDKTEGAKLRQPIPSGSLNLGVAPPQMTMQPPNLQQEQKQGFQQGEEPLTTSGEYAPDPGGYYDEEGVYQMPEVVATSPVSRKQIQERKAKEKEKALGLTDYLNLGAQLIPELLPGVNSPITQTLVNEAKNIFSQGKNYLQRQYALRTGKGDDLTKTKSEIKIPTVVTPPTSKPGKPTTNLTIDGMPYAEGSKIEMSDKNSRYYTKPLWLDLNSPTLKLGSRNRGSKIGNIQTEGFVITPFAKEYGMGKEYNDGNGTTTIRQYKDSEIVDDKIYGGVDENGTFYLDYGKNLKGKNLQMADFREMDVTGIAKNKKGKYIYGDATDNRRVAKTAKALDSRGKPSIDLNLLVPKSNLETGHESFGVIGGGRYILATPDLTKKVLVAGSLKNIDEYIEKFKTSTGSKVIKMIPLDNGTFARGLSTIDGVITDEDQANYDNFNNKGGAAFYLRQKKQGGPILPKAQFYNSIIGKNAFFAGQELGALQNQTINQTSQMSEESKKLFANGMGQVAGQFANQAINNSQSNQGEQPRYLFGKLGEKLDKSGIATGLAHLSGAANNALAFGNMVGADAQYRQFEENYQNQLRNKMFTDPMMPQENVNFRGNYVTNTGAFRPDSYTVNPGMYTANRPGANIFAEGGVIDSEIVMPETEFSPLLAPPPPPPSNKQQDVQEPTKQYKHSGANPLVEKTWGEISNQYNGVKFLGIWGDKAHQKRKSDHNDGNALDVGIVNLEQGETIANQLINEADQKQVKYIIFNRKIWSPDKGWTKYTGTNPHSSHVHVSFFPYEGKKTNQKTGESIALSHNNPGNIHFGEFTSQWGAEKGAYDNKGNIAKFKSLEEGWDAFNKLIKGKGYSDLGLGSARKKWVTGDENKNTPSAELIVKEMGLDTNTKVRDLTPEQLIKYSSLFVKYEDNKMYRNMKEKGYFKMGGQVSYNEGEEYDLTEDEINEILKNGGEIEFI